VATQMTSPNGACSRFEALLEDYLDSNLNSADAGRAETHMSECARCRDAFAKAAESVRLLRSAPAVSAEPGPAFARLVMARIRQAELQMAAEGTSFWQSLVVLGWRFAATAAFALLILVAYDAGRGARRQPNALVIRPIQAGDFLFASDPARPPADRDEVLMMVTESDHGNN
jgi:anti-sigma factor RsiW